MRIMVELVILQTEEKNGIILFIITYLILKIKEKNLKKILLECEHWTNMDWKEAEKMTPRFFERIEVHQGYQLNYRIVPEIQQFLPVMIDLENE